MQRIILFLIICCFSSLSMANDLIKNSALYIEVVFVEKNPTNGHERICLQGVSGSGVIISESGMSLTAAHIFNAGFFVDPEKPEPPFCNKSFTTLEITVWVGYPKVGSGVKAIILKEDVDIDVALINLAENRDGYINARLCYKEPSTSEEFYAYGFPFPNKNFHSVSLIHGSSDGSRGAWEVSGNLEHGMSGGPVYDYKKQNVIGLVSGRIRGSIIGAIAPVNLADNFIRIAGKSLTRCNQNADTTNPTTTTTTTTNLDDPNYRKILRKLYDSTNGERWKYSENWFKTDDICKWHGITCEGDRNLLLTKIELDSNGLKGSIPSELAGLKSLTVLDLGNNNLMGNIPKELSGLSELKYLRLHNNKLEGSIPVELGLLNNLTSLVLSSNKLTGKIPKELSNLSNLVALHLYDNELIGEIPKEFKSFSKLAQLYLHTNKLSGEIPWELGLIKSLHILLLSVNQLTGEIPSELGDDLKLSQLWLNNNNLTGHVPESIWKSERLGSMWLANNENLQGAIPESFANNTKLTQLKIQNTKICVPNNAELLEKFKNIDLWVPSGEKC